jgi:hypothetical protein
MKYFWAILLALAFIALAFLASGVVILGSVLWTSNVAGVLIIALKVIVEELIRLGAVSVGRNLTERHWFVFALLIFAAERLAPSPYRPESGGQYLFAAFVMLIPAAVHIVGTLAMFIARETRSVIYTLTTLVTCVSLHICWNFSTRLPILIALGSGMVILLGYALLMVLVRRLPSTTLRQ